MVSEEKQACLYSWLTGLKVEKARKSERPWFVGWYWLSDDGFKFGSTKIPDLLTWESMGILIEKLSKKGWYLTGLFDQSHRFPDSSNSFKASFTYFGPNRLQDDKGMEITEYSGESLPEAVYLCAESIMLRTASRAKEDMMVCIDHPETKIIGVALRAPEHKEGETWFPKHVYCFEDHYYDMEISESGRKRKIEK